jgi:preprotein translocase subunit SecF
MVLPGSNSTLALGDGAKSLKYRVTSKDKAQPVVEKTVEIQRLPESTASKIASANQSVVTPTVEVETSSGLNMSIWVALVIFLLIVILVFGMQKKKKNDANPTKTA